ncbi:metal ABC transporter substrate-binding protein [Phycicoccus flavus]|uniref:metal ABC transporter substrate-binding protein n=1 Tax=Phycicoccus flavus TaxID=2502783 RepID=UPI000FEBD7A2|nr:metal ABC transporter substrate-binding protein [Phycicoccus flavus]NHA68420.1 zinc ABC transporter substrate-binding protein [Phycicoccus flavus]
MTTRARTVLALAAALALTGCGGSAADPGGDASLRVSAAFYPLEWAARQVGGPDVAVTSLTKPGAEPHDLELTPKDVVAMTRSDLVVYLRGFQPAVDDAVANETPDAGVDVTPEADLDLEAADEEGHEEHKHEEGEDPHFWLDPVRLEQVVTALGERFADVDPAHAEGYRSRAAATVRTLGTLDTEYRTGLADCASTDLVTSHAAFGYLAERYGLHQQGIAGISPDVEPDAATLRDLAAYVREHDVRTIYTETLVSPALADTLARETGARTAVLDPLEGITDASQGSDYLEVMRSNLATLKAGQGCR